MDQPCRLSDSGLQIGEEGPSGQVQVLHVSFLIFGMFYLLLTDPSEVNKGEILRSPGIYSLRLSKPASEFSKFDAFGYWVSQNIGLLNSATLPRLFSLFDRPKWIPPSGKVLCQRPELKRSSGFKSVFATKPFERPQAPIG